MENLQVTLTVEVGKPVLSDTLASTLQYTWDLAGSCVYSGAFKGKMKNALLLLSTAVLIPYSDCNLIDTDIKDGVCEESVTLY